MTFTPSLIAIIGVSLGMMAGILLVAACLLSWHIGRQVEAQTGRYDTTRLPFPWKGLGRSVALSLLIVALAAYPLAFDWRDYRVASTGVEQTQAAFQDWRQANAEDARVLQVVRLPGTYLVVYESQGQERTLLNVNGTWLTLGQ